MFQLIETSRKSTVLGRPSSPCLSRNHTINLTAGCPFECRYCYAQSYRHNPGRGKVVFYADSLDLLRQELPRKRRKPQVVFFSTACEPFIPHQRIRRALYGVMELLLENSIFLLISTKSRVPSEFLRLFARRPDLVCVEVGLTTVDDRVRRVFEPNAAPVAQRLENLRRLTEYGIQAVAKMDPLIPELTDTNESFTSLCRAVQKEGVGHAAASYLFLRPGNLDRMNVQMAGWSFQDVERRLYIKRIERRGGYGAIRIAATDYKRERLQRLKEITGAHGIELRLCRCKNPDVTNQLCHLQPPKHTTLSPQRNLFD